MPLTRTPFRTGRWSSQVQAIAAFMTLDRLDGGKCECHAFGDSARTVLQMRDDALV